MTDYQIPESLASMLARRALQIAQVIGPRKSGKGLNSLIPLSQPGIIGLEIPDGAAYLFDLEKGIQQHAMVDLKGRVIPIRDNYGNIKFRRASANKIGTMPIITRLASDGRLSDGKPNWVYPKKDGLHFMLKSIEMSVDEWKRTATSKDIVNVMMQTDAKDDLSHIIYGRTII